jgi:hypothetical protein
MGIQPTGTRSTTEDRSRHRGPGTHRSPSDVVGPTIVKPPINAAAQTSRGKGASKTSDGRGENVKVIPRDELPQPVNYGST